MARQYYSMTMKINPNHRKTSTWTLERMWNLTTKAGFDRAIRWLKTSTRKDKQGRVLCYGTPATTIDGQKRIYIVKFGHDGYLWEDMTAQGELIRQQLK